MLSGVALSRGCDTVWVLRDVSCLLGHFEIDRKRLNLRRFTAFSGVGLFDIPAKPDHLAYPPQRFAVRLFGRLRP